MPNTSPATEKQVDFIADLLGQVNLTPEQKETAETRLAAGLNKTQASGWIERLKELRTEQRATERAARPNNLPDLPDVPAGHYAVTGEDGTTDFYKVDRPTRGRWEGYTFVKLQLSDDYQRVPMRNVRLILSKILADGPENAMRRYGHELGVCGSCRRTLTNELSRKLGIGPVCRRGLGWA